MSREMEYIKNAINSFNNAYGNLFLRAATNDFRDVRLAKKVKGLKLSNLAEEYKDILKRAEENSLKITHMMIDDTKAIKDFEIKNETQLNQIYNCAQCKCIDCIIENCSFSSCGNCRKNSYVGNCDKHEYCQVNVKDTLFLYNEDRNEDVKFDILGVIELNSGKRYILLQDCEEEDNKQMFIINDTVEGIRYDPIDSEEELERIANIYMEN